MTSRLGGYVVVVAQDARVESRDTRGRAALVDELDLLVRAVVRRDSVDPQREPARVRRIAEAVVAEHDERSLTGAVAPVPDVEVMVGELVARVSGFGPLQPFLDDPTVEESWIAGASSAVERCEGRPAGRTRIAEYRSGLSRTALDLTVAVQIVVP